MFDTILVPRRRRYRCTDKRTIESAMAVALKLSVQEMKVSTSSVPDLMGMPFIHYGTAILGLNCRYPNLLYRHFSTA